MGRKSRNAWLSLTCGILASDCFINHKHIFKIAKSYTKNVIEKLLSLCPVLFTQSFFIHFEQFLKIRKNFTVLNLVLDLLKEISLFAIKEKSVTA